MKYGICTLSLIPCREEPADASEMVSQLLFGEQYKILEERAKWCRIRAAYDKYESWIDRKQVVEISREQYDSLSKSKKVPCTMDLVSVVKNSTDNTLLPILLGSTLPNWANGKAEVDDLCFEYDGLVFDEEKTRDKSELVENAFLYLQAPYVWGGRSPFGIDCSGFSQLVYKLSGKKLPRDAYQQADIGQTLSFVEEAEPGDLAFFDNSEGKITHVGILLEDNYIIHASGKVRIDRIDHQGIYNVDTKSYSHKLRLIKRIL